MTTTISRIREAAFWERGICLACGETFEAEDTPERWQECTSCHTTGKCEDASTLISAIDEIDFEEELT